jgi:acetyltransferase-like isoleucine patch superfamily enzyme
MMAALRRRWRGTLAKARLAGAFLATHARISWSTVLQLDPGSGIQLGRSATVLGSGRITVGAGGALHIGARTGIMQGCEIAVGAGAILEIGHDGYIGASVNIRSSRRIVIGNDVRVAQFVSLVGGQYRYEARGRLIREQGFADGDVTIGDDVWLGVGVVVLSGVTVGTGAVVGAGAIVTKDVPAYAIVVGNPARIVGERR